MKMLLISNMYPSEEDKFYGIFVENFKENFDNSQIQINSLSTIRGRGNTTIIKIKKYLRFYASIIKNVLKFNYDLIYVHYPNYACLPLLIISPIIRKPIFLNFHGSDALSTSKLSRFLNFLLKPLIRKATLVIVPSPYFKKLIAYQFKLKDEKIFVSPSGGIDNSKFKPFNNKSQSNFTLGYVGRIDEGKGWDIFLKACEQLKNKISNLKCIIAGKGLQSKEMEEMVKNSTISGITSILGPIPHNELPKLINQFDLLIFPTIRKAESLGLVGIEALACGVPVIGSRIGGLQDYIIDEVNGKLFDPGNSEDLIATILQIYNDKKVLEKMKKTASTTIRMYHKENVAKKLEQKLIEKII